jgi:hypothetical protein
MSDSTLILGLQTGLGKTYLAGAKLHEVHARLGAVPEQVSCAVELQNRLDSPKYRQAILVAQTLLDDYPIILARGETSYSEIMNAIRKMNITYSRARDS